MKTDYRARILKYPLRNFPIIKHCVLAIIVFICLTGNWTAIGNVSLEVRDIIPRFSARDIYGNQVDIERLRGKVVIISIAYFDQSRKRSRAHSAEGREFDNFFRANRDKGLEAICISSKRAVPFFISKSFVESRARQTCKDNNDDTTVIIDWDNSLKDLLKVADDPLVFIVDKNGVIRYKKSGFLIVDDKVRELIEELL
ncbi:MAG: redoxin domain-containing protein [Candidatus Omnitrophota bacterium]